MLQPRHLLAPILAAMVFSACGIGGGATTGDGDTPPPGAGNADPMLVIVPGLADGAGISIDEAIAAAGGNPVLVNGALFVGPNGSMHLCSAIAESFPPQCGGSRLEVRGLDLATVAGLQTANGVRWAESVQLFGRVER